ncbi:hypothetical protein LP418_21830 [Nocardioides sp. B-3]|nr:hypothetical protein [Nocardioides sp. B-3]UUZ58724.1 hypothetical protein LP418_21830 [Nocardioides sp. B-3]
MWVARDVHAGEVDHDVGAIDDRPVEVVGVGIPPRLVARLRRPPDKMGDFVAPDPQVLGQVGAEEP